VRWYATHSCLHLIWTGGFKSAQRFDLVLHCPHQLLSHPLAFYRCPTASDFTMVETRSSSKKNKQASYPKRPRDDVGDAVSDGQSNRPLKKRATKNVKVAGGELSFCKRLGVRLDSSTADEYPATAPSAVSKGSPASSGNQDSQDPGKCLGLIHTSNIEYRQSERRCAPRGAHFQKR